MTTLRVGRWYRFFNCEPFVYHAVRIGDRRVYLHCYRERLEGLELISKECYASTPALSATEVTDLDPLLMADSLLST
jgi:hypothetical protein